MHTCISGVHRHTGKIHHPSVFPGSRRALGGALDPIIIIIITVIIMIIGSSSSNDYEFMLVV